MVKPERLFPQAEGSSCSPLIVSRRRQQPSNGDAFRPDGLVPASCCSGWSSALHRHRPASASRCSSSPSCWGTRHRERRHVAGGRPDHLWARPLGRRSGNRGGCHPPRRQIRHGVCNDGRTCRGLAERLYDELRRGTVRARLSAPDRPICGAARWERLEPDLHLVRGVRRGRDGT